VKFEDGMKIPGRYHQSIDYIKHEIIFSKDRLYIIRYANCNKVIEATFNELLLIV
jgi:hypothetical protein